MATKKPIKKAAKPASKKVPAKKNIKPVTKKTATKPAGKKVVTKKAAVKPAAKPAKKVVAKKPEAKKPVAKKAVVKKVAPKKVVTKKVTPKKATSPKPAPVKKEAKKLVVAKPEKIKKVKAPKPEKIKKPVAPPLSAKEIAAQKKAVKEALLKELDKKMPDPPPPPVFKRKVEEKSKKPIVIPKVSAKTSLPYKPDFTKSLMDSPKQQNTGPLIRYSDNELVEFREIIARKLDAARRELAYLQGLITRKDEMGGDTEDSHYMTMEDGSMSMEREQLSQMASRQITYIDHLEKALMRIENKTYGICRVTGKLIDKARLRAVPHATLSIEAKMMQK